MDLRRRLPFDWMLILLALALVGLGLLMISSATATAARAGVPARDLPVVRQAINALIALVALVAASLVNYHVWGAWRWVLYGSMVVALGLILVPGERAFGAQRLFGAQSWFEIGGFNLQPSEPSKIVLIIVLARYFADHEAQVRRGTGIAISFLITVPFLALIFIQPDMGTTVVLVAIWLGMLFVAGLRLQYLPILTLVALVCVPLVWNVMGRWSHMHERILMFLRHDPQPLGRDFNVIQALVAVGSGGPWGKGLGQGSQTQLAFLRVRHTDFIFSVLGEELGFVGCVLLLTLLGLLLLRIVHISARAGDAFGRLVASGVVIMIFVQVTINVGYNVGLLPVTGLPLPLISYGGSSLITILIGLGLVQSIQLYSQADDRL